MEKNKIQKTFVALSILTMLAITPMISALMQENVEFNGDFESGETLYSNPYNIDFGQIFGQDVYPIRTDDQNVRERVCETEYEEETRRVCDYVTYTVPRERRVCDYVESGEVVETEKCEYVVAYEERSKRICAYNWETGQRECDEYTYQYPTREKECRVVNETLTRRQRVCDYVTVEEERRKRECNNVIEQVPHETCRYETINRTTIACMNPNGQYTNSLHLENFKMSFDNGTSWEDIPYIEDRLTVTSVEALFKVDIPAQCSPDYYINDAITLIR